MRAPHSTRFALYVSPLSEFVPPAIDAEGAVPGAHQVVGGRLDGAVREAGAVGRLLGEARRVVHREVAVDLIGGDVVVAHVELAGGLQ